MTLAEAYIAGKAVYEGCGTHAVVKDTPFMKLAGNAGTWPGRFNGNGTQLMTRSELRELLDAAELGVAAEVADTLMQTKPRPKT